MTGFDQPAAGNTQGSVAGGRRLKVLLVEDDFSIRLLLQSFLSTFGECHIAVNGIEAVAAFRDAFDSGSRYDLVCMDIVMPEMDGRQAVREVRGIEEARGILSTDGAKIIMVTTLDSVREVGRCFEELCDAYLTKPMDLSRLLNQMKALQLVAWLERDHRAAPFCPRCATIIA